MIRQRIKSFVDLLEFELPQLPSESRQVAAAQNFDDLYRLARRRTPRFVFDYVEGGAGTERAVAGNVEAFARTRLVHQTTGSTAGASAATTVFGRDYELPVGISPIGLTSLMRKEGEDAGVRAAAAAGVPFGLSTMGTRSIEAVASAAPEASKWFQLYMRKDRDASFELVSRARQAGYDVLVVTVDTRVSGRRYRDERNKLSIPPKLTASSTLQSALHPRWALDLISTDAPAMANFVKQDATIHEIVASMFDPALDIADLEVLREYFDGPIVIKGVVSPQDAVRFRDAGADGVWLSNHGGRQLDRAVAPIDTVSAVRAAVGDEFPLLLDSGVRSGTDVVTAIAAGADMAFVGRGYMYALMAGGQQGVARYLEILGKEILNAMQLLGVTSVAQLREQGPQLLVR
ncbi:alpha-hydroxy acid oxidase [Corynebacterium uterequi]|uniref:Alpha-hydroxyacid dehydrogenase, FMN-dependent L-lactate dehydrogenase n=1 Tax=Corynebacterium uterequi TaxID=1072256 RepID=A0A0G3H9S6_9CORY|nr:alpha-hydroxy acid oxidase [Corynebacterium uterequi]AKK10089.1 alpha-hydroxyacid dehydrogenase, FMN-dependent L-lactate dehydrogenase [Corynebacterium uterequi]